MKEDNPSTGWPGTDEKAVVEDMMQNSTSVHWYECYEFVKKRVYLQARNLPRDQLDDLVQDAMLRTRRSLPTFQFECRFRNWLFTIIRSSIIDAYRRYSHKDQVTVSLGDPHEESDADDDLPISLTVRSAEEECVLLEELAQTLAALQEYLAAHANTQRNAWIITLVLFEGRSLKEAAEIVGCPAPVAGYVVRTIQQYLRERRERDDR